MSDLEMYHAMERRRAREEVRQRPVAGLEEAAREIVSLAIAHFGVDREDYDMVSLEQKVADKLRQRERLVWLEGARKFEEWLGHENNSYARKTLHEVVSWLRAKAEGADSSRTSSKEDVNAPRS